MQIYRFAGAVLGWFTLLAQYYLSSAHGPLLADTVIYFSFFTILGNLGVALAFTAPLTRWGFFLRPGVRTAIAVYIFTVGLIYFLLLRNVYDPSGFGKLVNALLHYVMPPLYLLDWALFVPKAGLRFRQIPFWLVVPAVYAGWTLLHGEVSGWYPYPFLDAGKYGLTVYFRNVGAFTGYFVVVMAGAVGVGKAVAGVRK